MYQTNFGIPNIDNAVILYIKNIANEMHTVINCHIILKFFKNNIVFVQTRFFYILL